MHLVQIHQLLELARLIEKGVPAVVYRVPPTRSVTLIGLEDRPPGQDVTLTPADVVRISIPYLAGINRLWGRVRNAEQARASAEAEVERLRRRLDYFGLDSDTP
jgi:hypothetical protein